MRRARGSCSPSSGARGRDPICPPAPGPSSRLLLARSRRLLHARVSQPPVWAHCSQRGQGPGRQPGRQPGRLVLSPQRPRAEFSPAPALHSRAASLPAAIGWFQKEFMAKDVTGAGTGQHVLSLFLRDSGSDRKLGPRLGVALEAGWVLWTLVPQPGTPVLEGCGHPIPSPASLAAREGSREPTALSGDCRADVGAPVPGASSCSLSELLGEVLGRPARPCRKLPGDDLSLAVPGSRVRLALVIRRRAHTGGLEWKRSSHAGPQLSLWRLWRARPLLGAPSSHLT